MFHILHELDSTSTKCVSLMETLSSMHYCKKAQVVSASVNFEFKQGRRDSRGSKKSKNKQHNWSWSRINMMAFKLCFTYNYNRRKVKGWGVGSLPGKFQARTSHPDLTRFLR